MDAYFCMGKHWNTGPIREYIYSEPCLLTIINASKGFIGDDHKEKRGLVFCGGKEKGRKEKGRFLDYFNDKRV